MTILVVGLFTEEGKGYWSTGLFTAVDPQSPFIHRVQVFLQVSLNASRTTTAQEVQSQQPLKENAVLRLMMVLPLRMVEPALCV